jgi:hypothetical protein
MRRQRGQPAGQLSGGRDHFAGLDGGRAPLVVYGFAAPMYRAHRDAEGEVAELVSWPGPGGELVERHDARLLLDPAAVAARPAKRPREAGAAGAAPPDEEASLDEERYRSLWHPERTALDGAGGDSPPPPPPAGGERPAPEGYAAVPFSYAADSSGGGGGGIGIGGGSDAAPPEAPAALPVAGPGEPRYVPRFSLPQRLRRGALPATRRHFAVIRRTAEFVRNQGGQAEVVLRVRHGEDPTFAFLLQGDPLHPFYTHLVSADPADVAEIDAAPGSALGHDTDQAAMEPEPEPQAKEAQPQDGAAAGGGMPPAPASLAALLGHYGEDEESVSEDGLGLEAARDADPAARSPEEATAAALAADAAAHGVLRALGRRLQRLGPGFEELLRSRHGSSPDLAFLHVGGRHHAAYAALLAQAVGPAGAGRILAAAAAEAAEAAAAVDLGEEEEVPSEGGANEGVEAEPPGSGTAAGVAPPPPWIADRAQLDSAGAAGGGGGDAELERVAASDPLQPAPPSAADEAKKAERRRKARELLCARQEAARRAQQEAVQAAAEARRRQLAAISVHKRMFAASDEDD